MKWTENLTNQFIKLYLSQEVLWYTENENYKVNEKRLEAYNNIITEFHSSTGVTLSLRDVKTRIKSLRAMYTHELIKIKKRSNNGYKYTSSIKWFQYWHKRFKRNARKSSYPLQEETEKDSSKTWNNEESDHSHEQTQEQIDPFISDTDGNYILLLKNEPDEPLFTATNTNPYEIKRKKLKHPSSISASEGSIHGSQDSHSGLSKEDEFDIYGKYIASQLRSMDLKKALELKLQIQGLVSEARLSDLTSD